MNYASSLNFQFNFNKIRFTPSFSLVNIFFKDGVDDLFELFD